MRSVKKRTDSDDLLGDLKDITLKLESGEVVKLNVRRELHVPTDPVRLQRAVERSASRLAFWMYQAALSFDDLKSAEAVLRKEEGKYYELYRAYFSEEHGQVATHPQLSAKLDQDSVIRRYRIAFRKHQLQHGLVCAIRDAIQARDANLRNLRGKREV